MSERIMGRPLASTRKLPTRAAARERGDRIRQAAVTVLRESGNPAVMWGDVGLLDMIARAAECGLGDLHPWTRHRVILDALDHSTVLVRGLSRCGGPKGGSLVRIFYLPEKAPARLLSADG